MSSTPIEKLLSFTVEATSNGGYAITARKSRMPEQLSFTQITHQTSATVVVGQVAKLLAELEVFS